jgi:hypothetical protein
MFFTGINVLWVRVAALSRSLVLYHGCIDRSVRNRRPDQARQSVTVTPVLLFVALALSSSLAIMYATPRQLSALRGAGIVFPAPRRLAISQGIVQAVIAAGLGVTLQKSTGFSLLAAGFVLPTLAVTLIGVVGHLILYYLVLRPRMPGRSVRLAEQMRLGMGLPARVLQGGITEEVQFRWGLMSVAAAIALVVFRPGSTIPVPAAIGLSAIVFALFHLAGARQIGLANSRVEVGLILVDNSWGGIIFGWLFWRYGLAAAMIAHATFHVVWFPVEGYFYRREQAEITEG